MEKFFAPATQYTPKHVTYGPLSRSAAVQDYVRRNGVFSFIAEHAVRADRADLETILRFGLERRVVLIDAEGDQRILEELPTDLDMEAPPMQRMATWTFTLGDAARRGDGTYAVKLPASFPATLSTGVFSADQKSLSLQVGPHALLPVQGWISRPFQYDVQNIKKGTLHFSLAPGIVFEPGTPVTLRYASVAPLNSLSATLYEPDRMSFQFQSDRAGWLVMHQPFDPKWKMKINGVDTRVYRANSVFIATPIVKGVVRVELEYMPASYLRIFLAISLLMSIVVLCWAFVAGARRLDSPVPVSPNLRIRAIP